MADEMNPYAPPRAELDQVEAAPSGGSIQDAVAGNYEYRAGEILKEAWSRSAGFKGAFWATTIIGSLLVMAVVMASGVIQVAFAAMGLEAASLILQFVVQILMYGAIYGVVYLPVMAVALTHVDGQRATMKTAFDFTGLLKPTFIVGILCTILISVASLLLLLPGIYLYVSWLLVVPLIHEHRLRPSEAMTVSRKAISHKWWSLFGVILAPGLVHMIPMVLLGLLFVVGTDGPAVVALVVGVLLISSIFGIWTMPWMALSLALVYRRMFGGGPAAAEPTPRAPVRSHGPVARSGSARL